MLYFTKIALSVWAEVNGCTDLKFPQAGPGRPNEHTMGILLTPLDKFVFTTKPNFLSKFEKEKL